MYTKSFIGYVLIAIVFIGVYFWGISSGIRTPASIGSINNENGYYSTSTDKVWPLSATATTTKLLKNGAGVFGSAVITSTGAGFIAIYDATTTTQGGNSNPVFATTTLMTLGPSVGANTYTVDASFSKGLLVETQSGIIPNVVVTWK